MNFPDLSKNASLAPYTTLDIGGPAEFFYEARENKRLIEILQLAQKEKIPVTILGGGSNTLISDTGLKGLIIKNNVSKLEFIGSGRVQVTSGYPLASLVKAVIDRNLNASFLTGIPGTVGGAIHGNAGAWGDTISSTLLLAHLFDLNTGEAMKVGKNWFNFGYRHSRLKQELNLIVLEAVLSFDQEDSSNVKEKIKKNFIERTQTQPTGKSCGSVFKNPEGDAAGRLIDECGLKGHQIGNIKISEEHANYFINTGQSTAEDFLTLAKLAQQKVWDKFKIKLRPEFQPLGFSPQKIAFLKK